MESKTPDVMKVLGEIEARAARALRDLELGGAVNGRSALLRIKHLAGDTRRVVEPEREGSHG